MSTGSVAPRTPDKVELTAIVGGREFHNRCLYLCSCCGKRSIFCLSRYFRLIGLEFVLPREAENLREIATAD